jgi:hypothetical protein
MMILKIKNKKIIFSNMILYSMNNIEDNKHFDKFREIIFEQLQQEEREKEIIRKIVNRAMIKEGREPIPKKQAAIKDIKFINH